MELLISLFLGAGLSAACGMRVFVPPLVMGVASMNGYLTLGESFAWMGTTPAVSVFAAATVLEIGAYFVPWIDNLLDTIATPAAVGAGVLATAAVMPESSPVLEWAVPLLGGGGIAGLVQGATVLTRATSSATTAGLGNPLVSAGEAGGSVVLSVVAILLPVVAGVAVLLLLVLALRKIFRRRPPPHRRQHSSATD